MSRLFIALVCLLYVALLTACHVDLSVEAPWMEKHIVVPLGGDAKPAEPQVTPGVMAGAPKSETEQVLHAVALHPLTDTVPFNRMTPVAAYVAPGCTPSDALANVSGLGDYAVLASLTRDITSTTPATYLDPSIARTLYRVGNDGADEIASSCPQSPVWLWQQIFYASSPLTTTPTLLTLSHSSDQVCAIPAGYTLNAFEQTTTGRGEWPELIYLQNRDDKYAVVFVAPLEDCGSGANCTFVHEVCKSIFEDGQWEKWCESLCE